MAMELARAVRMLAHCTGAQFDTYQLDHDLGQCGHWGCEPRGAVELGYAWRLATATARLARSLAAGQRLIYSSRWGLGWVRVRVRDRVRVRVRARRAAAPPAARRRASVHSFTHLTSPPTTTPRLAPPRFLTPNPGATATQ